MSLADMAERAARLAKADLVTGMVGEFPELQGLMGGYYAAAQGEPREVADAIRDHYKPVGQGDDVPTAPVTVAVSLADKLDTLACFFAANLPPTGSKDPFALRRAAIASLVTITQTNIRVALLPVLASAMQAARQAISHATNSQIRAAAGGESVVYAPTITSIRERNGFTEQFDTTVWELLDFFADRLKVQQREAGVRHDLIDAVFALGGEDDLVRLLARVRALQAFVTTGDGTNLLAGYKRAANILKKEGYSPLPAGEGAGAPGPRGESRGETPDEPHPSAPEGRGNYTPEPAEAALIAALDAAEPAAASAVAREDFEGAMAALASLRAPIDTFFDDVTVNDPDPDRRAARLALLARVRAAVHAVADFSKIEG